MLIISQHVAVRNRRSQQSCASGCSSLFYIAENSGSAACLARRIRRADAALRCQCSSFSSSLNTPWKLRSKMKIWNLFEELGIAGKTKVKHFCKSQCSSFSTLLNQGPLITDGRNSNDIVSFQNIIMKYDLGISKVMKIPLPNFNDMDFRS